MASVLTYIFFTKCKSIAGSVFERVWLELKNATKVTENNVLKMKGPFNNNIL